MTVLSKNGDVYADGFGFVVSRIVAFFEAVGSVIDDALEMRAAMTKKYGHGDW